MAIKDAWRALFQRENATKTTPRSMRGEIGYTGSKIFSGLPMNEYNPDLSFPQSVTVYDQMRRSDGQIAAILSAIKLPIRSAKWYVEPEEDAENENLAQDIADFVEDNLLRGMKYSFDDHLREALLFLDYGFSVFEKVWRFDTWNGRSVVMIDKYAPRVAASIWRFPEDEKTGDIAAVEQLNYYTGQLYTMPLEKCRVYTYQREGDDPTGISALRPAYKHWYYKDSLYRIMAVGVEKMYMGTPYGKMPKNASDQDRSAVLQVLSAIRTAQEAAMTIPTDVELDVLENKGGTTDGMPLLEHHDTQIARSVLAQFLNLGTMSTASGGSYALGQTMSSLFVQSLESIANYIQEEVQSDIEQLVEWNFGPDAPMPQLRHGRITIESVAEQMAAIGTLGTGHLLNPDESLENHLRNLMGLPPIPQNALTNQTYLPPNRYTPDIIPDRRYTPEELANLQKQQAAQSGQAAMSEPFTFADDDVAGTPPASAGDAATAQTWKRPLTGMEDAEAIAALDQAWRRLEQRWINRLGARQQTAARELVDQVRQIVTGTVDRVTMMHALQHVKVPTSLQQQYAADIETLMGAAYDAGAKSAAKELDATAAVLAADHVAMAAISAKADLIATDQLSKLEDAVKYAAIDQIGKKVGADQLVRAVRETATAQAQSYDLKVSSMISVGEALNIGRGATALEKGVQGAQWSAVLDDHTCPLCESLDGKAISVDDPDFDVFRPPLHIGCRCFLVYVGTGQSDFEPDWKTPDPALVKKYGKMVR